MRTRIPTQDGAIDGYLAQPEGSGPWPGVVVVHDALGLGQDIRNIADRFAGAGYLAIVPDLYSRGGRLRCVKAVFQQLMAGHGRAFDDLDAARQCLMGRTPPGSAPPSPGARSMLAGRADCTGKVGVVGFCMGGGFALAAASREFAASAPYYGQLPNDLSLLDGACPVVASFGRKDPTLRGAAAQLEDALRERDVPHDVKEYPDAGHSFANHLPFGPLNVLARVSGFGYHHESSEDAWRRVLAFFGEHLS
ncbi:carboxymethylenebutenolidase [Amycolatopsis arida]|uniref:Carboxymethylenebutenolidase n=1 Tax=Amycolatopsis arida TaxID=587909 RepID=A0A1I5T7T2_9PSEU|nr:dienelactone hydrolase family protein [Amycolatopsis arida]TDX96195.1 carboxymethylenebutenolidase [Amycolatopsis arida]SFP79090.1 carboxymethylenebutenolidase [Amycolatopsis arida]